MGSPLIDEPPEDSSPSISDNSDVDPDYSISTLSSEVIVEKAVKFFLQQFNVLVRDNIIVYRGYSVNHITKSTGSSFESHLLNFYVILGKAGSKVAPSVRLIF